MITQLAQKDVDGISCRPVDHDSVIAYAKSNIKVKELRQYQKDPVQAVLEGKDVFVSHPTGSGKSLIYQMLPFATEMPTVKDTFVMVVSPLVSLMRDQTLIFKELEISSLTLSDDCAETQVKEIKDGGFRML